jgi:hypothetical protein
MEDEPDLQFCGLSLWIDSRQFPDANDFWDSNWLTIRAIMKDVGACVTCGGPILRTNEIERFRNELAVLHASLNGEAILKSLEPGVIVSVKMESLGHAEVLIEITPDHLNQQHRFFAGTDQSYLPGLIASCDTILSRFPVINTAAR